MKESPPPSLPPALAPLVRYLNGLNSRAPLAQLETKLRAVPITLEDVCDFARFSLVGYRRNIVAQGPWYSLLVLCWRSGQRSPIHDHAQSSCAFKVLAGVCSETVYDYAPCGQVFPLHTVDQPQGAIVATQDADTHQVSNLQPAGRDLVTLHIYSPPLQAMHSFSILGENRLEGTVRPRVAAIRQCGGLLPPASSRRELPPNRRA